MCINIWLEKFKEYKKKKGTRPLLRFLDCDPGIYGLHKKKRSDRRCVPSQYGDRYPVFYIARNSFFFLLFFLQGNRIDAASRASCARRARGLPFFSRDSHILVGYNFQSAQGKREARVNTSTSEITLLHTFSASRALGPKVLRGKKGNFITRTNSVRRRFLIRLRRGVVFDLDGKDT